MAKFCTNCGKELKEEAVFCEYCGSKVNDSINSTNSSNNRPMISKRDVAMAIILSIITCGIYGIYWNYKNGQKLYEAGKKYNKDIQDNSVLYLVLSLFGLQIVSYCFMQNDLNKFAE